MGVKYSSTARKKAILEKLNGAKRIGNGQRWVIELADGKKAMLKTSLNDNIMVTTDVASPEDAVLSGFTDDVDYVLTVTGELEDLTGHLIPIDQIEKEFRRRQREWMDEDPENRSNTTWSLNGIGRSFPDCKFPIDNPPISPDEARRRLAVHFNTTPDKIHISISV